MSEKKLESTIVLKDGNPASVEQMLKEVDRKIAVGSHEILVSLENFPDKVGVGSTLLDGIAKLYPKVKRIEGSLTLTNVAPMAHQVLQGVRYDLFCKITPAELAGSS